MFIECGRVFAGLGGMIARIESMMIGLGSMIAKVESMIYKGGSMIFEGEIFREIIGVERVRVLGA